MSKLTEVLRNNKSLAEFDIGKSTYDELEAAILAWVDEVIGEDEPVQPIRAIDVTIESPSEIQAAVGNLHSRSKTMGRNEVRAEQRKRAGL